MSVALRSVFDLQNPQALPTKLPKKKCQTPEKKANSRKPQKKKHEFNFTKTDLIIDCKTCNKGKFTELFLETPQNLNFIRKQEMLETSWVRMLHRM